MNFSSTCINKPGIRKAAVLVASLDHISADLLLDQLDERQADMVRQAVMELDDIDDDERRRVINEFCGISPLVPDASPAGIELTDLPPRRTDSRQASEEAVENSSPFGFLHDTENEKLAELLDDERPQTVALVLSHFPPVRAADVLDQLAPALQVEVVRRLVDLDKTDPQTLREIEDALETRLARLFDIECRRSAGPQSVVRMLDSCNGSVRRRILENIAVEDCSLAERFGRREPSFDDIAHCSDAVLAEIYRTVDSEVFEAALLGMPSLLFERFLRCMSPNEAKLTRRKLACPGPIRLSDVDEARREIALLADQLAGGELSRSAA